MIETGAFAEGSSVIRTESTACSGSTTRFPTGEITEEAYLGLPGGVVGVEVDVEPPTSMISAMPTSPMTGSPRSAQRRGWPASVDVEVVTAAFMDFAVSCRRSGGR